jgi:transcriptional regulator with PAS, ATPase and Fis domain
LSGYTDVDAITAAINEGHIYQFILKPWNNEELKSIIKRTLEQWEFQMENRGLTEKIKKQNEELKILNADLEKKVTDRTKKLFIRNQALMLVQQIVAQLPVGVIGTDEEGTIVFLNEVAPQFFDGTVVNALGSKAKRILPEELSELIKKTLNPKRPADLTSITYRDTSLTVKCAPFEGRLGTKGTILIAFEK